MRRFFQNLLDVHRQAEINRLVTRAARRCARDLHHALDHIPANDPNLPYYRMRCSGWKAIFWDSAQYRDLMHHEISRLEDKVRELETQVRELGGTPKTGLPF